jgi:hypothetical protein
MPATKMPATQLGRLSVGFSFPANALIVVKEAFVRSIAEIHNLSPRQTNWTEFNQASGLSSSEILYWVRYRSPKATE